MFKNCQFCLTNGQDCVKLNWVHSTNYDLEILGKIVSSK